MKKFYIILAVMLALAGIVYFFGFYTYFITTEVQEILPSASSSVGPQVLATGSFGEVDFIHKGSGEAKLIDSDGKKILRLENFSVTNGPALYVYLTESTSPTNDIKSLGDFIDLGPLKATTGNQNYEIPEPFRGYNTAIIWCQRFGVLFTYAVMK